MMCLCCKHLLHMYSDLFSQFQFEGDFNHVENSKPVTDNMDSQRSLTHTSTLNPYANSIVPTEDGFHYSIQIGDRAENGAPYHYAAEMDEGVEGDGGNTMPTWAVVLMFLAICVLFLGWCLYAIYAAYKSSNDRQALAAAQQQAAEAEREAPKEMSRKERLDRLLAYFERSGNQTVCRF